MATYTRTQVIEGRKCGLKAFDKAVAKVGIEPIIREALTIYEKSPKLETVDNWGHMFWAFSNAWRDIIEYYGQATFNLDEVFTKDQLQDFAEKAGLNIVEYRVFRERKPEKK